MKNKAFTLIELLAVIVILAIIALIATPIIMNIIKDSKIKAAEISADNYVREIEIAAMRELKLGNVLDGEYIIQSDGNLCKETSDKKSCEKIVKIDMKGKKPYGGKILIKKSKVLKNNAYVHIDGYSVAYKNGQLKVSTWLLTGDMDLNGRADIGDLITIGTESFYVYSNDGNEIKALAQYNLKVGNECLGTWNQTPMENTTGLQDSKMLGYKSGTGNVWHGTVAFSNSSSAYDNSEIKKYVDEYAKKLEKLGAKKITTRLITSAELKELGCNKTITISDIDSLIPKNKQFVYSTTYWLETPYNDSLVRYVGTNGKYHREKYTAANLAGVRPVVIISASEV